MSKKPRSGSIVPFTTRHRRLLILGGVIAFLGLVVAGLFVAKEWRRAAWIASERAEGLQAREAGDPEGAIEHLGPILNFSREDREVLEALAEAREAVPLENGGHILAAIRIRQMISELDPEDLEAAKKLMGLYAMAGFAAEAERQADEVIRIGGDDPQALSIKMQIASSRGRPDEAERLANRLLTSEDADIQSLRSRISLLAAENLDIDAALERIRGWQLPRSLEAARQAVIADLLMRQGKRDAAVAVAEAATRLPVSDLEAAASIADSLDRGGETAKATAYLEQSMLAAEDKEGFIDYIIRRHWRAGRLELAKRELDRGENVVGRNRELLLRWRLRLAAAGLADPTLDQTVAALEQAASLSPPLERRAARTWAEAVRLASTDPDSPATVAAIDAAIEASPRDGLLRLLRGERRLRESKFDPGIEDLRVAHDTEARSWVRAGLLLAVALESSGAAGAAVEIASEQLGRYGDQLPVIVTFASIWANYEATGRSLDDLRLSTLPTMSLVDFLGMVFERSEGDPRIAVLLAEVGQRQGDVALVDRALTALETPRQLPAPLVSRLAQSAVESGSAKAELALKVLEATAPDDLNGPRLRAVQLAKAGRAEEGFRLLAAALAEPSRNVDEATRLAILAAFARRHGIPIVEEIESRRLALLESGEAGSPLELLSVESVWQDETRARRAIDLAASRLGASHPEVVKAEARWTLTFRPDEEVRRAPLAESLLALMDRGSEDPAIPFLLARLLALAEQPDEAQIERALRRRMQLAPNDLSPYAELAGLLLQSGKPGAAAELADELLGRAGAEAAPRRQAALILEAAERLEEAEREFRSLVASASLEADRLALARILERRGTDATKAEASRIVIETANLPDASAQAVLAAVDVEVRSNDPLAAWRRIEARQAAAGDLDPPVLAVRLWLLAGDAPRAADAAASLEALERSDAPAVATLADWLASVGRLDEAVARVRASLLADLEQPVLVAWAAERSANPGWRLDEAPPLREAISGMAPGLVALAELQRDASAPDGSIRGDDALLERSLAFVESYPRLPTGWRTAVLIHLAANRRDAALDLARRGATALPRVFMMQELLARLLLESGRPNDARLVVEQLAKLEESDPVAVALLDAECRLALRDPRQAIAVLDAAGDAMASIPAARTIRASALLQLGRIDEAIATLDGDPRALAAVAMPIVPRLDAAASRRIVEALAPLRSEFPLLDAELAIAMVQAYPRSGDEAKLALAEELAAALPADPQFALLRGDLLAERGKLDEAIASYQTALGSIPAADRAQLANWSRLAPERQAALASARAIAASSLNNMAYRRCEQNRVDEQALAWIDEASAMMPDVSALRDTRALVLLGLDRVAEARVEAEAAVLATPDDPAMRFTLATILARAGARSDASRQVAAAIAKLDEEPGTYPALRRKLERLERAIPRSETPATPRRDLPGYLDAPGR